MIGVENSPYHNLFSHAGITCDNGMFQSYFGNWSFCDTNRMQVVSSKEMKPSDIDWVGLWKICHVTLFEMYIVLVVPTMFLCARRLVSKHSTIAATLLSAGSLTAMWWPIGAGLWIMVEELAAWNRLYSSLWNGVLIAALMALGGTVVGALILRYVFKTSINGKVFAVLYGANLAPVALSIAMLLIWISKYPPQIIA